jgi:hypothetical protein
MALKSPKPREPENSPKILRKSSSGSTLLAWPLQYCCPVPAPPACPAPPRPAEPYVSYCFLLPSSLRTYHVARSKQVTSHKHHQSHVMVNSRTRNHQRSFVRATESLFPRRDAHLICFSQLSKLLLGLRVIFVSVRVKLFGQLNGRRTTNTFGTTVINGK